MKIVLLLLFCLSSAGVMAEAKYEETPYAEPKVVFDFFLDNPKKMASALFWIRSLMNPLMDSPYDYAPEFMQLKVVIHGTEIVTLAEKNYSTYKDVVERMRYYASLGVQFRICALAAEDYGYLNKDFYDFVTVVPSAMTELSHWQQQGYGLITPQVLDRKQSIEEIR